MSGLFKNDDWIAFSVDALGHSGFTGVVGK